mgnify:FL=1
MIVEAWRFVSVMTNANSQYDKQNYFVMTSGKIKDNA